eukprot:TRINITY_DN544_c0_g1_i1.p1 TRINITY_DN544_c0_g1~~TRINITY_DN544_c0_g1_i1.p1  ORF type:complete len:267 (+),score=62.46 TRINITY_DN544_c0_g1_i1:47-802(+)
MTETIVSKLGKTYPKHTIMRKEKSLLAKINTVKRAGGNAMCAECGDVQSGWASVTLGVFVCTQCSQIHRGLGAHISKVKSCMGTYIWCPDEIEAMERMGNDKARLVYCHAEGAPPAAPRSFQELEIIARNKYDKKKWHRAGGWEQLFKEQNKQEVKPVETLSAPQPAPAPQPVPAPQPTPAPLASGFEFINEPPQPTVDNTQQPDFLDQLFSFPDVSPPAPVPTLPEPAAPPPVRETVDFIAMIGSHSAIK